MRSDSMTYHVVDGMLVNKMGTLHTNHPAIILDREVGTLHSVGDIKVVGTYFNQYLIQVTNFPELSKSLVYIAFDRYEGILNMEEVCTFINMLKNSLGGERVRSYLAMDSDTLKAEIKKFSEAGF